MKLTTPWRAATGLLAVASQAAAKTIQYCPGNADGLCFSIAVPTSSASSGSGNIYFQIKAPASLTWAALGTGSTMPGSNMFVVYRDGQGNVTISARRAQGYNTPLQDTSEQAARLTLLAGSGVNEDGSFTANVACANCDSWATGSMSLASTAAPWIGAWRPGDPISTTDANSRIPPHDPDGTTRFQVDLTQATINSDSNPFVSSSSGDEDSDETSDSNDNNDNSSNSSSSSGVVELGSTMRDRAVIAHGVILALVFAVLYPTGSLMMPLVKKWWFHMAWQSFSFGLMWGGFGMGIGIANERDSLFKTTHTTFGTVVIAMLGIQPILGHLHHRYFLKHRSRGAISYLHIWYGRILMILGVVNGGLGLRLAREEEGYVIAYSVVAGVIFAGYFGYKAATTLTKASEGADGDGDEAKELRARSELRRARRNESA